GRGHPRAQGPAATPAPRIRAGSRTAPRSGAKRGGRGPRASLGARLPLSCAPARCEPRQPPDMELPAMSDTPPDRLSNDPNSPFYDAAVLERDVAIRFNG